MVLNRLFFVLCASLVLLLCACVPADHGETTISTAPDFSAATTVPVSAPTESVVHQPAEPKPTEPQETRLQREGEPLGVEEIADLMQLLTDSHSWYPTILKFPFDSPAEINCYNLFCNGAPGEKPFEPTDEERAYLTGLHGEEYFRLEVDCIDRSVMYEVLSTYFGLTDEEIPTLSTEGLTYMEETDRYYSDQNSSNKIAPLITEAYVLPDGNIAVYFCDYSQYRIDGADWSSQYRAVFRWEEDHCVFQSNELIYDPYAP